MLRRRPRRQHMPVHAAFALTAPPVCQAELGRRSRFFTPASQVIREAYSHMDGIPPRLDPSLVTVHTTSRKYPRA
eukprot:1393831-Rhodomonas_salina.1